MGTDRPSQRSACAPGAAAATMSRLMSVSVGNIVPSCRASTATSDTSRPTTATAAATSRPSRIDAASTGELVGEHERLVEH